MAHPKEFDDAILHDFHAEFDWPLVGERTVPPRLVFYGYLLGVESGRMVGAAMLSGRLVRNSARFDSIPDEEDPRGTVILRRPSGHEDEPFRDRVRVGCMLPMDDGDSVSMWVPAHNGSFRNCILSVGKSGVNFAPQALNGGGKGEEVLFIPTDPSSYLAANGLARATLNDHAIAVAIGGVQYNYDE